MDATFFWNRHISSPSFGVPVVSLRNQFTGSRTTLGGNHTDKRIRKSFLLAPIELHEITMHVNSLRAFLRMGSNLRLQPTKT